MPVYDFHGKSKYSKTLLKRQAWTLNEGQFRAMRSIRFTVHGQALRMKKPSGRTIPLSLPRRWIGDLVAFSQKVPTVAVERTLRVKALTDARGSVSNPPGWCAIFTKSFGIVSARFPELRRSYLNFPFARLYEHPQSVAALVVGRDFQGEDAVFLGLMQAPETLSLPEIQRRVRQLKESPIKEMGSYRRLIRTTKFPWPIRRMLWWYGLCVSGKQKSTNFGTYSVNSVRTMGIRMIQFLVPITSTLYYSSPGADGELNIQMAFDHRVFDALTAGRALAELEKVLNNEMVAEITKSSGR